MSVVQKENRGELVVSVRFRNEAMPVRGASVRIYRHGESISQSPALACYETDSSGKTPPIPLPAPPAEASEASEAATSYNELNMPYALYDIEAEAPQMEPCVLKGVQLFSETLCIQPIDLFPLKDYGAVRKSAGLKDGAYELIEILPHSLWEGFATAELSCCGYPKAVAVPEYVVVHDGEPSSSAPDYWLPYREYIKMSASQSICPLWHVNAIRAGILAIVSLTLSRASAKPYEPAIFTLTSEPYQDLPFSYGRCIYKNISVITDEVFNNYIAYPNEELPVAAGISDGLIAKSASALPLWEAQSLARRGYSTMNILKHFFGQTIYLETAQLAPRFRALPAQPYSGHAIGVGTDSPSYVKIAQKLLNSVSEMYPSIKKIKPDGIFGDRTRESVAAFQKTFFLDEDGIIGKSTWYRLWEIGGWRLSAKD